jgi:hypothetical protein
LGKKKEQLCKQATVKHPLLHNSSAATFSPGSERERLVPVLNKEDQWFSSLFYRLGVAVVKREE